MKSYSKFIRSGVIGEIGAFTHILILKVSVA